MVRIWNYPKIDGKDTFLLVLLSVNSAIITVNFFPATSTDGDMTWKAFFFVPVSSLPLQDWKLQRSSRGHAKDKIHRWWFKCPLRPSGFFFWNVLSFADNLSSSPSSVSCVLLACLTEHRKKRKKERNGETSIAYSCIKYFSLKYSLYQWPVQCAFGAGGKTVLEPTKTATRHHPCKNSKFVLFFLTSYGAELLNANNTVLSKVGRQSLRYVLWVSKMAL